MARKCRHKAECDGAQTRSLPRASARNKMNTVSVFCCLVCASTDLLRQPCFGARSIRDRARAGALEGEGGASCMPEDSKWRYGLMVCKEVPQASECDVASSGTERDGDSQRAANERTQKAPRAARSARSTPCDPACGRGVHFHDRHRTTSIQMLSRAGGRKIGSDACPRHSLTSPSPLRPDARTTIAHQRRPRADEKTLADPVQRQCGSSKSPRMPSNLHLPVWAQRHASAHTPCHPPHIPTYQGLPHPRLASHGSGECSVAGQPTSHVVVKAHTAPHCEPTPRPKHSQLKCGTELGCTLEKERRRESHHISGEYLECAPSLSRAWAHGPNVADRRERAGKTGTSRQRADVPTTGGRAHRLQRLHQRRWQGRCGRRMARTWKRRPNVGAAKGGGRTANGSAATRDGARGGRRRLGPCLCTGQGSP